MPNPTTRSPSTPQESDWKPVVPVAALISLIGEDNAIKLCRFYQGYKVPSILNYLRTLRDVALVNDWLEKGATVAELSAKYGLDDQIVEQKIAEGLAARRKALQEDRNNE